MQDEVTVEGRHATTATSSTVAQHLQAVIGPLLKSTCSARGTRHFQDTPGTILAAALAQLPPQGGPQASHVLHAVTADIAGMLVSGTMPVGIAGSFQALQVAWEQLHGDCSVRAATTKASLQAVLKALKHNSDWTVRLPPCSLPMVALNASIAAAHRASDVCCLVGH